ncbi:MAG: sulfotransferase [Bacteroidales bacterium]|jgi:hypothetical protein|nr:sulfotransferase [Bacteroidales bacterium]
MKSSGYENGPVIIGGVGGSGTRVVAEIVTLFGFHLGKDLNQSLDNLTYTLLFKRPAWFIRNYQRTRKMTTGLRIMEKTLLTGDPVSFREKLFVRKAVSDMAKFGHNREKNGSGDWPLRRLPFINNPEKLDPARYKGWGWKEPNSHLMVPVFDGYFKDFRYIHMIRHGLDMAYSSNQQQLYNWAPLFGINVPEALEEVPGASFRYWVEANRKVISFGDRIGIRKFLLVNFDKLCLDPLPGVKEIADFLQLSLPEEMLLKASKLPVMPESAGRYKNHSRDVFNKDDLLFLEEIGFRY